MAFVLRKYFQLCGILASKSGAYLSVEQLTQSSNLTFNLECKQSRAEQSRAEQSRAEQSRAEQSRAEQSRAEQSRAEQSRAEQSIAELSRA